MYYPANCNFMLTTLENPFMFPFNAKAFFRRSASNPPPTAEWYSLWRGKAPMRNRFPICHQRAV